MAGGGVAERTVLPSSRATIIAIVLHPTTTLLFARFSTNVALYSITTLLNASGMSDSYLPSGSDGCGRIVIREF